MSNDHKTKRNVKIFTMLMVLLYLAILVVASIPSVGAYCTTAMIYPPHFLAVYCLSLFQTFVIIIFYFKRLFVRKNYVYHRDNKRIDVCYRR